MLLSFFWLIINLAERMFWISHGFDDDFQRFGHSLRFLLFRANPGMKDAKGLIVVALHFIGSWHQLLQAIQLYDYF